MPEHLLSPKEIEAILHSHSEESVLSFRQLLKERDEAARELSELRKKNECLEEKVSELTGQLLKYSQRLTEEAEKSRPLTHNARGAGRKRDPVVDIRKEMVRKLLCEGYEKAEIMKKLGISKSTYYRYVAELEKQ